MEKGGLWYTVGGNKIDTAIRKNSMEVFLKFKIKLPCDLDIPLWGQLLKGIELESKAILAFPC